MILAKQQESFDKFIEKQKALMFRKGNDYANEDRLSSFKYAGNITGVGAKQSCLNLVATKVARLGNLLQPGKQPNFESIEDSLLDLGNYTQLLNMLIEEENELLKFSDSKLKSEITKIQNEKRTTR